MTNSINIKNRKASFEYSLLEKFVAGIQLTGTEIKSIRTGKVSFVDSYCAFLNNELWVINLHISEYEYGSHYNHEPKRNRKLLLNKKELKKIYTKVKEKGFTVVPTFLFINEKGLAKLEIAVAKGKQLHDKREAIKRKDAEREMKKFNTK
ncbi:MAG: SsrA-binding protein SmpB [Bacteroidales bacterium]|nr:SsrA-binding protein SmpB [Bacteroidales bacterium]